MDNEPVVIINSIEYPLKPLTFAQLKKAWPILSRHMNAEPANLEGLSKEQIAELMMTKEMAAADDAIKIIAISLNDPTMTAEWIEENLLASEMGNLQPAMMSLLEVSGLVPEGNALEELEKMTAQFLGKADLTGTSTQ